MKFETTRQICKILSCQNRVDILEKIKDAAEAGVPFGELRYALNLNNNTLTDHLKRLKDISFIIQKYKGGKYFISEQGKNALEFGDGLTRLYEEHMKK